MQVWRPGIDPLAEDEELDYDPTAYDCLHRLQLDWPCLRWECCYCDICVGLSGIVMTVVASLMNVVTDAALT